jgi:glucokinase
MGVIVSALQNFATVEMARVANGLGMNRKGSLMSKWCIGIDLGGTFIKFGLLDEDLRATETFQLPTPQGADAVIAQMIQGAKQAMDRFGVSDSDVVGVGVGSPGPLDVKKGIVIDMPNLPGMKGAPLRDGVGEGLGKKSVLVNDANAAAMGEYLCGAGKGTTHMILLTLGTGVGGGIILDGRLFLGGNDIAGELGHMIVEAGGEPCPCGQKGCLERYCSATNIAAYANRLLADGRESALQEAFKSNGAVTTKDINEARLAGDVFAEEVWDRGLYYLGVGCASIARIFDPEEIVLAGGLTKAGDDLLLPVRRHFEEQSWTLTPPLTRIELATLGADAGSLGAAGVMWQELKG